MIPVQKTRHFINGLDLGEPRGWQGLVISKDFINEKEEVSINIADLEFVLKANKYLQERLLNGLSGGVGVFEGEPYKIVVGDEGNPVYTFDGYLDFTDELTVLGKEELICSLKKRQGNDWLNDVADGFSFAYLADQGVITTGDYVKVPYVINYVPDGVQLVILSISLYMMTKELIENVQAIAESIADLTDAATPVIGVGVGFGAVAVTAWDIGNFILAALKLIARIAYTIAIVIAIKELIEQIFEQLLPAKRYHLGMRLRTMFERACQHLGLQFESSIEELDWIHIPRKDKKGGESGDTGYPTNDGPIYTFGELIRVYKEAFNADYIINNGVFRFERKDKFYKISSFTLPNYFTNQERLLDGFSLNTNEMVANYNINWAYDVQDQNTLDDQTGRVFQAITTPINVVDQKLVNIKGLSEVSLPFSIGKTKTSLTDVESLAKDLGQFVDNLTGIFGGGTNFAGQIKNRIGSLLLSSHFLTVGKMVKMSGNRLVRDQRAEFDTRRLWDRYHFINSFAEINGVHNQFWRYPEATVPMTLQQFSEILESNIIQGDNGETIRIETIDYTPHEGKALITYRINRLYTNNLKVDYV